MADRNILKLSIVVLLVLSFTTVFASGEKRNGTAGAQELLIPVGAKGMAMASTDIAGIIGVEALYYNPAGLSGMEGAVEASFSIMNYIADVDLVYGAVGVNLGGIGALGLSVKTLHFGDIPVTTVERPEGTGAFFSPRFTVLGLSYSNFLTASIKVGVTFNLISEEIMSTSATGLGIDAGVQYERFALVDGLKLGLVLKNFGPQMSFEGPDLIRTAVDGNSLRGPQFYSIDGAAFELPSQLALGMTYEQQSSESFGWLVTTAYESNNFANDAWRFGGEVGWNQMFFLRAGYSFVSQAQDDKAENIFGPTLGAGLNLSAGSLELVLDYAYRFTEFFDNSQVFALRLFF